LCDGALLGAASNRCFWNRGDIYLKPVPLAWHYLQLVSVFIRKHRPHDTKLN